MFLQPASCLTDGQTAIEYLGICVSVVKDWKVIVVTLSCEVLPSHTEDLAEQVQKVLSSFFVDPKMLIMSCHDGAANVKKASKLLKFENFQHCIAHSLHLLLTVDSINVIEELSDLVH